MIEIVIEFGPSEGDDCGPVSDLLVLACCEGEAMTIKSKKNNATVNVALGN